jgi:hypothetical protein
MVVFRPPVRSVAFGSHPRRTIIVRMIIALVNNGKAWSGDSRIATGRTQKSQA